MKIENPIPDSPVTVQVNVEAAKAQRYSIVESLNERTGDRIPSTAERAAKRGLRWLKNPKNLRKRPPYHIARKLQLIKVTK